MADTTIDEVIERLAPECSKAQLTGNPASIPMQVMVADVLALLWEIAELRVDRQEERENYETVRAERDALRAALEVVQAAAVRNVYYASGFSEIIRLCNAALNTQPQAEWTPRLGMRVITSNAAADDLRDITGTVQEEIQSHHWMVKLDRRVVGYASAVMFLASELAPVDESEA